MILAIEVILVSDIPYIVRTSDAIRSELIQPIILRPEKPLNYASHIPYFAWQSIDIIKRTFDATSQYIHAPMITIL